MYAKRQTTFPCDICSKTYTAFNTLKNHKSSVHNVKVQNWKSEKQNFRGVTITPGQGPVRKVVSCNICAKQFESVELLAKHLVSGVHGKDKCNICHKKFSSVHFLAKHLVSGDHGKGKQVGVSSNKAVKTNPKVVDVIDVDLDDEPIKFNIPQPVQKMTAAKKRRSDGDNVEAENAKKTKVDSDLVVEEESKHWLDKMMKEVDDFSNNLINLVGDVKKNWSGGVKSEQCVTETTEKLREVLQISKNYIELIDKSVIDEYWANNNQSELWAQVPPLDEEAATLEEEAATLDENGTSLEEDGNSLDESVSLDENEETETVCTPDLPDLDLDAQIDLDGEPVFETAEESNDAVEETVEDNSASETVDEIIDNNDEDEPIDCDTETTVDTNKSDTVGDQSAEETEIKEEENDGSILEEKPEDVVDSEMNAKDFEEATEAEEESEENFKQDETSKEEKEDSESGEETEKYKEKAEEINETNEVDETEEDKTKTATMEETDVEEKAEKEESVKEDEEEQETSESKGNKTEDSAKAPPSSGMVLFASWCQ